VKKFERYKMLKNKQNSVDGVMNLRVDNIVADLNVQIETKTDAYRYIMNDWQKSNYIEEFGNVGVEYDAEYNVWRVPEFKEEIAEYSKMKMAECRRWGCE